MIYYINKFHVVKHIKLNFSFKLMSKSFTEENKSSAEMN